METISAPHTYCFVTLQSHGTDFEHISKIKMAFLCFFPPVERLNPLCGLFTAMTDKLCKCACMCPRVFVTQNHKNVCWRLYAGLSVEFIWRFSACCMWNTSRPGVGRNWIQCELKFNNVFQFRMLLLQSPIIYFPFLFNPCAAAAKTSNVFFYVS